MFNDILKHNLGILWLGVISFSLLAIVMVFYSPILLMQLTFSLVILITIIVILGGFLLNYFIGAWISLLLSKISNSEVFITLLKIIGIIGSLYATYIIINEVLNIEWEQWGIKSLYNSMSSPRLPNAEAKSLFHSDVWPEFKQLLKALFVNIGSILILYIVNYVPPFSWIFTTIGIFKNN